MTNHQTAKRVPQPADTSVVGDDFAKFVQECRRARSPRIIENLATSHAQILLRELIGFAADEKVEIRILTGNFFAEVYDALAGTIKNALDRGVGVRAITLAASSDISSRAFYDAIRNHAGGKILSLGLPLNALQHFFLAGSAYRVEVDDGLRKAYASFNDEDGLITDQLREDFDLLWASEISKPES